MSAEDNPAWCHLRHERAGLVTNQDPDQPHDPSEPLVIVSVCDQPKCIAKGIKHVAGSTNRQAAFYSDAERRSKKAAG